ncbi:MAG: adenosylcobinamide kinase/adenosylcobinamide phosphate guanyltransferase [Acidimicrobiaceae bacterium]|nr:adenosylcobinamide kinase/adenosylcobinamide phosphate guanyltransferase [Acidimicrobiaceae bacterium]
MRSVGSILVLGGTRSGKSSFAESLLAESEKPEYLATLRVDPADVDALNRVASHRDRRGDRFVTREIAAPADLLSYLRNTDQPFLLDSIGNFVASSLFDNVDLDSELVKELSNKGQTFVVVSEEVGLSLHPESKIGRDFVDRMGAINQRLAQALDDVYFVHAGIPVLLRGRDG